MSTQRVYDCNLRGIDVDHYRKFPYLYRHWDYTPENRIGKVEVLKGKRQIRVTYIDRPPSYKHSIGTSVASYDDDTLVLFGLAAIPVLEVSNASA